MDRTKLAEHIQELYQISPDHPFAKHPTFEAFRHQLNRKWFALVMDIPREKLGLEGDGMIDVVNVKCDPLLIGALRNQPGIYPAYHMNKTAWLSVALDGSVAEEQVKSLIEISFDATGR